MERSTRYIPQKKQERISRHQLCERVAEFGWMPTAPAEDLGEDFLVHIYFQGQATGVIFHLQLKSITNLNDRRKADHVVYDDLKVKDLKHWEDFKQPVVLVIWDIKLREGRWALVDDVIKDLDQRHPAWRTNKSKVRVHIPWQNTTDDAGLSRLKHRIGKCFYPLISRDKPLEMSFRFPDTENGYTASRSFERTLKEGEPVEIKGEYIQNLDFSEWWMQWFGEFDTKDLRVRLSSQESDKTILAYIDISSNGKTFSAPTTELKLASVGTEVTKLSNRHQNLPLIFDLTIPKGERKQGEVSIGFNSENWGRNVSETREIVRFLEAVTTGGKLILNSPPHGDILAISVSPQPEKAIDPQLLHLLDKLCKIQGRVGQNIQIPSSGLVGKDTQAAIDEILAIVEYGKTARKTSEVTGEFKGQALEIILDVHSQRKPIHLTITHPESYVELFGRKIPTGRISRHITGTPALSVSELEEAIKKIGPHEYLAIKFVEVEIVEVFPDWYKAEAQRLSQCLINEFGIESVFLFGSLVWSDIHSIETDIDLAVKGLAPERYLEAIGFLERESKFRIDLVELDKVHDHLSQRILTEGELLNEREPDMAPG